MNAEVEYNNKVENNNTGDIIERVLSEVYDGLNTVTHRLSYIRKYRRGVGIIINSLPSRCRNMLRQPPLQNKYRIIMTGTTDMGKVYHG